MIKSSWWVRLGALCAAALVCGGSSADEAWPGLAGRVGPYSGLRTADDVKAAAADGFTLTVQSTYDTSVLAVMRDAGINHIDIRIWNFLYAACRAQTDRQRAAGVRPQCALGPDEQQSVLRDAAKHLDEVKGDPNVAGYWILDDYPQGNVGPTLLALHGLIEQANRDTGLRKPTICGVGGSLDHRTAMKPRLAADRAYIELSLQNILPAACDVVAPYFYGAATENDPTWVDWTMSDLYPWFLQRLHAQGFSQPTLLPVVQAFMAGKRGGTTYYVKPRPADMAAQARAYCSGGAIGLLFFSWSAGDVEQFYSNDADLRSGVKLADDACREAGVAIPPAGRGR
jgi:hypothetical protein